MRDFWETLCISVKQIKAPYLFDWEQGIALHAVQGYRASSFSEQEVMFFRELQRKAGVCSRVTAGVALKTFVCSATSGLLSSYDGHLRNLN